MLDIFNISNYQNEINFHTKKFFAHKNVIRILGDRGYKIPKVSLENKWINEPMTRSLWTRALLGVRNMIDSSCSTTC